MDKQLYVLGDSTTEIVGDAFECEVRFVYDEGKGFVADPDMHPKGGGEDIPKTFSWLKHMEAKDDKPLEGEFIAAGETCIAKESADDILKLNDLIKNWTEDENLKLRRRNYEDAERAALLYGVSIAGRIF